MKTYTIKQAADRLGLPDYLVRSWFKKDENPLVVVSGETLHKINKGWGIPEHVLVKYETFLSKHMTVRELSQLIDEPENKIRGWIRKGLLQSKAILNKMYYISIDEVPPLKNAVKVDTIIKELGVSRITAINYIKEGIIAGGFLFANSWYAPRENVEKFKLAIEFNSGLRKNNEYLMPSEAASILGIPQATLRKIVESGSMGLNGYKLSTLNRNYWFKRNEVEELKQFFDAVKENYMNGSEISNKYGCSISAAHKILHKTGHVKLAYYNKRI